MKSSPAKVSVLRRSRARGLRRLRAFFLAEVIAAVAVVALCGTAVLVSSGFALRRHASARIESRLGGLMREHSDIVQYLAYDLLPPDGEQEIQTGFLWQPVLKGEMSNCAPYTLSYVVMRTVLPAGTGATEKTSVTVKLVYSRPNFSGTSSAETTSTTVTRGPFTRLPSTDY